MRRPQRARRRRASSRSWIAASSRIVPPCAKARAASRCARRPAFRLCLGSMRIDFTKMHGVGNDFIVFDAPADGLSCNPSVCAFSPTAAPASVSTRRWCCSPQRADTAVFYRIFNADGDEVEQCGNGARCIAALLHHRGLTRNGAVALDSPAGVVRRARRAPSGCRSTWACQTSTRVRCRSRPGQSRTLCAGARRPDAADRRGLDRQPARGAARGGGGCAPGGLPRACHRASSALSAAGQCRLHAGRGLRAGAPARLRARRRRDPELRHRRLRGGGVGRRRGLLDARVRVGTRGGELQRRLGGSG